MARKHQVNWNVHREFTVHDGEAYSVIIQSKLVRVRFWYERKSGIVILRDAEKVSRDSYNILGGRIAVSCRSLAFQFAKAHYKRLDETRKELG